MRSKGNRYVPLNHSEYEVLRAVKKGWGRAKEGEHYKKSPNKVFCYVFLLSETLWAAMALHLSSSSSMSKHPWQQVIVHLLNS